MSLLLPLVLAAFLAALGRSAVPHSERLPWRTWTLQDLAANVVHGGRVLIDLHQRRDQVWDRYARPHAGHHPSDSDVADCKDDDRC